jgi:hypothetical protein
VPEPLEPALARLRPLLADPERLVRAVGAGRRRGALPAFARAELRPVRLKAGLRLQVTTTDGRTPAPSIRTANHAPARTPSAPSTPCSRSRSRTGTSRPATRSSSSG